ncbi:hypothetical protein [Accumulibacter sp.]|uniref:hypothetical protein n=1 Tax=Accumulibacter sp. TaxID=2053492 RepID=UPI0025D4D0E8|nr:hypothetical protein [Accumulibacter sp.]MCP5228352.1 hypothetical protein [Accumulibacter sp.]
MNVPATSCGRVYSSSRSASLILATVAAVAWIATHRYQGIWHDGVLYAGQAIFRLDPTAFSRDLFFAYGSQDGFTVFTGIYALAIAKVGLPTASALLLGMSHVAWIAAAAFLLRELLTGLSFWLGLVLVAVLPATYGSSGIFSYGETFLTARVWAEPPALLAVAFILRGDRVKAISSLVFAAAMHPVIAFPAALFVFFFGFGARQQVVLALFGFLSMVALNLAGIPPFAGLNKVMDPLWLSLSVERSPFVFVNHWTPSEHKEAGFLALLLFGSALVAYPGNRRVWWCALAVFATGIGMALLAVLWPGVLLIQMQPWRVLWLVRVLAVAAGVCLVQTTWLSSPYGRILLGALLVASLNLENSGFPCAVLLIGLIVAQHRFALDPRLPLWFRRVAWGGIILMVGENIFWRIMLSSVSLDFTEASLIGLGRTDRLFIVNKEFGWFITPALFLGVWALMRHRPVVTRWLLVLTSLLFIWVALHWQRSIRYQAEEDHLRETGFAELTRIIQPHHLTYWEGGHPYLWFILRRGSYASFHQAAGLIFSRETAIESYRRLSRLRKLGVADSRFSWLPTPTDESPEMAASLDGLIHVCHDPILDFVVLAERVAGTTPVKTFSLSSFAGEFHLYACAPLRAFPDPFLSSS